MASEETMMAALQQHFNPADFHFEWTSDWYKWDRDAAHKAARKARDEYAKALKATGRTVTKSSTPGQLITRGGIGSGRSQIEMFVTVYAVSAR
jgi:hypothetical protein